MHIFVAEDRDAAAYLLNDFYNLLDEKQRPISSPRPTSVRSAYGAEDAPGRGATHCGDERTCGRFTKGYLVVCTYPEALAERVVDAATLQRDTIDRASSATRFRIADAGRTPLTRCELHARRFRLRTGAVLSCAAASSTSSPTSESLPYRFDFFGEEVDSIRRFNISSQLSAGQAASGRRSSPTSMRGEGGPGVARAVRRFWGDACYWFYDADYALRRVDDLRRQGCSRRRRIPPADGPPADQPPACCSTRHGRQETWWRLRDNAGRSGRRRSAVVFRHGAAALVQQEFRAAGRRPVPQRDTERAIATYILSENKAAGRTPAKTSSTRSARGQAAAPVARRHAARGVRRPYDSATLLSIPTTRSSTVTSVTASTARSGATSR